MVFTIRGALIRVVLILAGITLITILARVGWFQRLLAAGSARLKSAVSRG